MTEQELMVIMIAYDTDVYLDARDAPRCLDHFRDSEFHFWFEKTTYLWNAGPVLSEYVKHEFNLRELVEKLCGE